MGIQTGCSGLGGLPQDAVRARTALRQAIASGDVDAVGDAARVADEWRGRDAELDRLLGHALANVLMRPEQGLELLEGAPASTDPAWVGQVADAALRKGDFATLQRVSRGLELPAVDLLNPVVEQYVVRARQDSSLGWDDMAEAVRRCELLDAQPRRGRLPVDRVAPASLPHTALALGAARVVMGRPERLDDHDPLAGSGNVKCETGRLVEGLRLPRPLPRNLTVAAEQDDQRLYVFVKPKDGEAWAYGANDSAAVLRWLDATDSLDAIPPGDGWPGVDEFPLLRKRFGPGLVSRE